MDRLYSIGDVHEMTGISVSALRYYADMKIVRQKSTDRPDTAIMILMIFSG